MKALQNSESDLGKPSSELLDAISKINLLPISVELPDILPIEQKLREKSRELLNTDFSTSEADNEHRKNVERTILSMALNKCLEKLPAEFKNYIFSLSPPFSDDPSSLPFAFHNNDPLAQHSYWFYRYTEYRGMRDDFLKLFASLDKLSKNPDFYKIEATEDFDEFWNLPEMRVQLTIDPETKRLKTVLIGAAALVEGVDVTRLRVCEICKRLFWAFRKDAFGCSKKCCQNYRIRKHRNKQKNRFLPRRNGNL